MWKTYSVCSSFQSAESSVVQITGSYFTSRLNISSLNIQRWLQICINSQFTLYWVHTIWAVKLKLLLQHPFRYVDIGWTIYLCTHVYTNKQLFQDYYIAIINILINIFLYTFLITALIDITHVLLPFYGEEEGASFLLLFYTPALLPQIQNVNKTALLVYFQLLPLNSPTFHKHSQIPLHIS